VNVVFSDADFYALSDFVFRGLEGRRYVVFDVESTGADVASDSITQIGAVAVYDDGPRDPESFVRYVRPWKPIPKKIEQLTGVTNELVQTATSFAQVWSEFGKFCGDAVLVTQCGYEFDFPIIAAECGRCGVVAPDGDQLDTKAIFAIMHPDRREVFSTNFLSEYYGIKREGFKRHDALGDAQLISRIFQAERKEAASLRLDAWEVSAPIAIGRFKLPPL